MMLAVLALFTALAGAVSPSASPPYFIIGNMSAAANPHKQPDGSYESFVSFDFTNSAPEVLTTCYAWAPTADLSIADVPVAFCENKFVIFRLLRVAGGGGATPGFELAVRFAHPDGILSGTHWLPRSDVVWATAQGRQVEVYVGEFSFLISNVTELVVQGDDGGSVLRLG